jgi:hypothetical protein
MPLTGSFTGIGVAPQVDAAVAQTQQTVRVVFSEGMTATADLTDPVTYTINEDLGSDPRTVSSVIIQSASIVVLTLDGLLTPGTDNYEVEVADTVIDLAGNPLDPANDTADFGFSGAVVSEVVEDPVEHIGLLNIERYQSAWGIGWGAFGASDEPEHLLESDVNHAVIARRRLIAQYQDTNFADLAEALGERFQELENLGVTVRDLSGLDTAWGPLLDAVGDRLGLTRQGFEDNTYRTRLAGYIMSGVSQGSPEHVRAIVDMLMQSVYDVRLETAPPGCMILRTQQLSQAEGDAFARLAQRGMPIGCRLILEWELPILMGPSFGFEDDNTAGPWAEFGEDASGAGNWAEGSDGGA